MSKTSCYILHLCQEQICPAMQWTPFFGVLYVSNRYNEVGIFADQQSTPDASILLVYNAT